MTTALVCIMVFGFLFGFMLNSHLQWDAERKAREQRNAEEGKS